MRRGENLSFANSSICGNLLYSLSAANSLQATKGNPKMPNLDAQLQPLQADAWVRRLTESRKRLAALDPYRPLYHFSSPENYMNDPNGLCQWRGLYHLFYQFRPADVDRVHWGHAVSEDLVRWRDLPVALYPTTERDCFSGQTLMEDDRVIAIYHGTRSGNAVATASDDLLLDWMKHPQQPRHSGRQRFRDWRAWRLPRIRSVHLEGRRRLLLHIRHLQRRRARRGRRGALTTCSAPKTSPSGSILVP